MNIEDIYIGLDTPKKHDVISFFIENYLKDFKEESEYYEYPPFFGETEFETENYSEMISYILKEKGRTYRFYFENLTNREMLKGMIFINRDGSIYLGVGVYNSFSKIYQEKLKTDFHSSLIMICNEVLPPDNLNDFKTSLIANRAIKPIKEISDNIVDNGLNKNLMADHELKILFKELMDDNEVIGEQYKDGDFLYVFTQTIEQRDHPNDDRHKTVGGKGPIRLNLLTNEFERIHYMDFPSEIVEITTPVLDQISKGILERKYVNQDDIFDFVKNVYGEDFSEVFDDLNFQTDEMYVSFKVPEVQNKLQTFLEKNKIKYSIEKDGSLKITRVPRSS